MLEIKLCIFDLDGTLLNSNREITKETLEAISNLKKNNINYTIATGRLDTLARKYQRQINSDLPIISCNGSLIRDLSDNVLYKETLNFNIIKGLFKFYIENNLNFMFYTQECVLTTKDNPRLDILKNLDPKNGKDKIEITIFDGNIENYSHLNFLKSLVFIDDREFLLNMEKKLKLNFGDLSIVSSDKTLLDVMPTGVTKGSALSNLCRILKISPNEVCVFGDNFNDIEMIEFAKYSIVPENGEQRVKDIATYITKSNNENGIAYGINKFILKNKNA